MKRTLLATFAVIALCVSAASAQGKYKLVWKDDFKGDKIDSSKWEHEVNAFGGGNNELQYYTDRAENSFVKGGKLHIVARKEHFTGAEGTREYTSARMRTKGKADFLYGRFEARMKIPCGKGIWPAFWMLPTEGNYGGWPSSGEVDIMEILGHDPRTLYGTIHFGASASEHRQSGGKTQLRENAKDFCEKFHNFRVDWEPNEFRWYLDGNLYYRESKWSIPQAPYPAPFDKKFHLLLNLAVGGNWPGNPDDKTEFPAEFVIDWVKVWQRK